MSGREYTEIVDDKYVVTFKIEGRFVTITVYDKDSGDSDVGYQHFLEDPTPILENPETRKLLAETAIKVLKLFRKYHQIIGNVIEFRLR